MFEKLRKFFRFVLKVVIILVTVALLALIASELAGNPVCMAEVREVAELILGAVSACIRFVKNIFNWIVNAIAGLVS